MEKEKKPAAEKKQRSLPQKIVRVLLKTVLYIFLLIVLVFLLILTPPVQRFLTGKVETYLQNKLKTKVKIGSISFGLSGRVNLQNVYIEDRSKDTLISGGMIKAHLNFLKLFSNEVEVKDLELQNITAKIKRVFPDTVYNFQFITDAFMSQTNANPDTAKSAPMKLNISDIALDNINITYKDVVTGNDVFAHIGTFNASIDTLDLYTQNFSLPTIIARNVQARVKQTKPLVVSEPMVKDMADAVQPTAMKLNFGTIDLNKISIQFDNDVSAFYSTISIGQLKTSKKLIDLQHNKIYLDQVALNNSKFDIRLGKKEAAKVVSKQVNQEITAQKEAGWDFKIDHLLLDNNKFQFDNDNNARLAYGLDYAHMLGDSLTLHADNFIMNTDSVAVKITKGTLKEKSGLKIEAMQGDILYASNQTYLRNLYIKTPGSQIQKSAELKYASLDALTKDMAKTQVSIELVNSTVQVKDILLFAPQLRNNPAMKNPNDVWHLNIIGSGDLNRLSFEKLQFRGLSNTELNAQGTIAGLMNPNKAGGNFTIYRFHTTQTDMALFTGTRLSNAQLNLPEAFDISGTVIGNAGSLNTNLHLSTSAGGIAVNGKFSNLMNPDKTTYNAAVRVNSLRLGSIMRQPDQYGTLSGNFTFNGKGITPNTIDTRFTGNINSVGYSNYQYRNIKVNGSLKQTAFSVSADVNDPNADLNLTASGNFSSNPSFRINGMIDSIKTLPLHLTPDPFVFRGKIDGNVSNIKGDNMDANVMITNALFVSGTQRLPLDTIQFTSGRNDTANYIQLKSDIANAYLTGQYKMADLGTIVQNTMQPYFSVSPQSNTVKAPAPYNFRFNADLIYSPVLAALVPGLTEMQPVHMEGNFATGGVVNARITTPHITYNGNDLFNVNLLANGASDGLHFTGNIDHIKSGSSFDMYNARLNGTAMNNNIDFNFGVDDQNKRNKYYLSGLLTQPSSGVYAIKLKPDSLLLNYEKWTVTPDNLITIKPNAIAATDFVLQKGNQKLSINSLTSKGEPVQVNFNDFRVATITGFIKSDSLLVDGVMNGTVTLENLMQQPLFTSNLTISDLSLKKDTIGNVSLQVSNSSDNKYITNATITGRGNDVSLTGSFAPSGNDVNLDLDLNVKQLQLKTMEGALADAMNNASGSVNGHVRIAGNTTKPKIQGDLNFDKASFAVKMLGSQFRIDNEKLSVTENGFVFDKFTIRDSADNQLTLDGNVLTSNFINYNFNLDVKATNFELLNSTKKQNKLYYGKLNITSALHIAGTEVKPIVDGSVTVNDGTNMSLVVPQAEPGVVEREGVVQFTDIDAPENDYLFLNADSLSKTGIKGMDIAANIEIKKEAKFNVVIDEANGDFLNVQGEALLSTGIDPSGKITLVGNYTLDQGAYQLSFNFLQRRFDIQKGSTITWTGEPTTAQLNVTAIYVANTAPLDLVGDQISAPTPAIRNTYLQKLPFEVHLNLTGELLKPVIAFDIVLPQDKNYGVSNDIVTAAQTRLDQLRQDEGEINKQVFSLLLLGRFVGENPFKSSAGGGFDAATYARESVSKLLTEQLNNLAAGLFDDVGLNFDVASSEDYTTGERRNRTDLNVGLSKRLLNDRLQISVGSNFELEGPQGTNQKSNNIAGNIAVNYQVSKDGRYLLRFYRRNQYEGIVDGYIIETGVGFVFSVDYNKFVQIFHKRRQKVTSDGTTQNPKGQ